MQECLQDLVSFPGTPRQPGQTSSRLVCLLLLITTGSLAAGRPALRAEDAPRSLYTFREKHLAVDVELRVYADDEASANAAARAAYARIEELNAIFSDYDADSEVMKLCRTTGPTPVSAELFSLIHHAREISDQTDGAFDITAAPLIKQWRRARRQKMLPTSEQIALAKSLIGYQRLKLDADRRTVELSRPGILLDFGGIAKGYIAEEAFRVLESNGCPQSLVSVAGDIFAGDPPPGAAAWKIGVAPLDRPDGPPGRYLALQRQAVSTSGDAFQFVEIDGVRYSHIVDLHTGLGLTRRSSVTVIAPQGWIADGYATAICLVGVERGLKLIEPLKATETLVVYRDDQDEVKTRESPGLSQRVWKD